MDTNIKPIKTIWPKHFCQRKTIITLEWNAHSGKAETEATQLHPIKNLTIKASWFAFGTALILLSKFCDKSAMNMSREKKISNEQYQEQSNLIFPNILEFLSFRGMGGKNIVKKSFNFSNRIGALSAFLWWGPFHIYNSCNKHRRERARERAMQSCSKKRYTCYEYDVSGKRHLKRKVQAMKHVEREKTS